MAVYEYNKLVQETLACLEAGSPSQPLQAAATDGDFITGFGTETPDVQAPAEPETSAAAQAPEPLFAPESPRPSAPRRKPKELKIPMTYKHRETHYKRLKRISQALEIPMGELLDEALEAKFADWEAEIRRGNTAI